jgi:hypothetical protein
MRHLPSFKHGLRAACLLLALVLSAGCGPGLGGSGTGPSVDPVTALGAMPSNLCGSELAASLQCGAAGPATPAAGTAAVAYADATQAGALLPPALARFEGNRIDFELPCQKLRFSGQWGQAPGQSARFFGFLEQGGTQVLASLSVLAVGDKLQLQLRDAQGQALGDTRTLTRLQAAPPAGPSSCGQ